MLLHIPFAEFNWVVETDAHKPSLCPAAWLRALKDEMALKNDVNPRPF